MLFSLAQLEATSEEEHNEHELSLVLHHTGDRLLATRPRNISAGASSAGPPA
jgi:hypothetical protein